MTSSSIPVEPTSGPGPLPTDEETKLERRALYRTPEFIASAGLMTAWSLLILLGGAPVILFLILLALGLICLFLTVATGAHGMVVISCGYQAMLIGVCVGLFAWFGSMSLAVGGWSVLLLSDFLRINFARRRRAEVTDEVLIGPLAMSATAALLSFISVGLAVGLSDGGSDRSWLWVPVASGAVLLSIVVVALMLTRRSGTHDQRRWRPGDRMLPQPTLD